MADKKPSENISTIEGKVIVDSSNRQLMLRQPDLLDMFDLMSALPKDVENSSVLGMAMNTLYIAKINDQFLTPPKSYAQIRANLKIIGMSGFSALNDFLEKENDTKTEQEATDKIKK